MRRAAGDDGAAAGEGANAPVELVGVAGGHFHLAHVHAELLRHHLREGREVALALSADSGRERDLAAGLHAHSCALIGSDACPLDVTHEAEAEVAPLGACPRLFLGQEAIVIDRRQRLV